MTLPEEIGGASTLFAAVGLNIWEAISNSSVNGWFVFFTSVGGLIYLIYKIITQRKQSKLLSLEIKQKELEIENLKK